MENTHKQQAEADSAGLLTDSTQWPEAELHRLPTAELCSQVKILNLGKVLFTKTNRITSQNTFPKAVSPNSCRITPILFSKQESLSKHLSNKSTSSEMGGIIFYFSYFMEYKVPPTPTQPTHPKNVCTSDVVVTLQRRGKEQRRVDLWAEKLHGFSSYKNCPLSS